MKTILPLLLGILVFTFTGCNKKKKELKIPTDVAMKMDINRSQSPSNGVRFTSGKIFLSDFSVEGEREEGEDIAFTKTFSGGLWINFDRNKIISSLDFDIPQGNYYRLEIDFSTKYNNGNNTIELNGTYTDSTGVSIPLIFEYNSEENFEIEGESDDGSATIILDKNNPETTSAQPCSSGADRCGPWLL